MILLPGSEVIGVLHLLKLLEQFLCGGNELTCNFIKMNISFHDMLSNLFPGPPFSRCWKLNSPGVITWFMQSGGSPLSHLPHNREPQPGGGSITNLTSNLILLMMYPSQPLKMPASNANAQLGLGFNECIQPSLYLNEPPYKWTEYLWIDINFRSNFLYPWEIKPSKLQSYRPIEICDILFPWRDWVGEGKIGEKEEREKKINIPKDLCWYLERWDDFYRDLLGFECIPPFVPQYAMLPLSRAGQRQWV